jgi:hypothetical protein
VIVSHTRRFIFIKSTKTAGTSLEAALSAYCSGADVVTPLGDYSFNRTSDGKWIHHEMNAGDFQQEEPAESLRTKVGERVWGEYFKFSIARNPWDRAVSSFSWHRRGAGAQKKGLLHRLVQGSDEFSSRKRDFALFVRDDLKTNDRFYVMNGELCVDFVIRYESLTRDLAELCRRVGLPSLELPRLKAGIRNDGLHYSRYFDADARAAVADKHANDIRLFGYRFEEG